jgi:hypothetical protein
MSGGNTGTEHDKLYFVMANASDTHYVISYTFKIKGAPATSTSVYPVSYISSGTQIKHTDTGGFGSLAPISIPESKIIIASVQTTESAANACIASATSGRTTVSVAIENSGSTHVTLDDIVVTLPSLPTTVTYVAGSSSYDGVSIATDPTLNGQDLTWTRAFTIPAGTTKTLTFEVDIPASDGTYTFLAVGHLDSTQIDATLYTGDSAPMDGFSCVGVLPTATPIVAATSTPTITPTSTPTTTPTITPTQTSTPTPSFTPTPQPSATPTDSDFDDDGIPNSLEGSGDTDGDGVPDWNDLDSDNDGLLDSIEGDGTDSDGDGEVDSFPDTDKDGAPDYRDRDSDGDGITDGIEGQDDYVAPSSVDTDGDGIDDSYDPDATDSTSSPVDTDGDGTPDFRDTDSDGDGSSDFNEAYDFNGDGVTDVTPSYLDANGNGVDDAFELFSAPSTLSNAWRDLARGNQMCEPLQLTTKMNRVTKARTVLLGRAKDFASRIPRCGRARPNKIVTQSNAFSKSIANLMSTAYQGNLYTCSTNICQAMDRSKTKAQMLTLASKLGATAKNIKLRAMAACPKKPEEEHARDNRKRSDDYTNDLLKAIKALPSTVHDCT